MDIFVRFLNSAGAAWNARALAMAWQAGLLVALLLLLDRLLARRVRASVRHAWWCLLALKLLLPADLALPTSPAWWFGVRPGPVREASSDPRIVITPAAPVERQPPAPGSGEGAVVTVASAGTRLDGHGGWFLVWLAGWVGFGGLVAKRAWRLSGMLSRAAEPPAELAAQTARLAREIGLRRVPRLVVSAEVGGPAVCGGWRPTIVLPPDLVARLEPGAWEHVLLHELMHVKRRDLGWSHLQSLLLVGYWMNPLLWLADGRIRRVREEATDEAVAVARRGGVLDYAETLLGVARLTAGRAQRVLGLVGILDPGSGLAGRIRRLVTLPVPATARVGWRGWGAVLALALLVVPLERRRGEAAIPWAAERPSAALEPSRVDVYAVAPDTAPPTSSPSPARGLSLDLTGEDRRTTPGDGSGSGLGLGPGSGPGLGLGSTVSEVVYSFRVPADVPREPEAYRRWLEGFRTALAGVAGAEPRGGTAGVLLEVDPRTPHRVVVAAVGAARSAGFSRVQVTGGAPEVPQGAPALPATGGGSLTTRTYRLAPAEVSTWLTAVGHPGSGTDPIARRLIGYLESAGFPRGGSNAVFFNEHNGRLLVRASADDQEVLGQALDVLTAQLPAMYQVDAVLAWVARDVVLPAGRWEQREAGETARILTAAQRAAVMRVLEEAGPRATTVSAPRIATLDGRQAQVVVAPPGARSGFGAILDVLPERLASFDRLELGAAVTCRQSEEGGDEPGTGTATGAGPGSEARLRAYLEHSSQWRDYDLADGESVLLRVEGRRIRGDTVRGVEVVPADGPEARDLVAIIRARQIDPAGNFVRER